MVDQYNTLRQAHKNLHHSLRSQMKKDDFTIIVTKFTKKELNDHLFENYESDTEASCSDTDSSSSSSSDSSSSSSSGSSSSSSQSSESDREDSKHLEKNYK